MRPTPKPNQSVWRRLIAIGSAALTMVLLSTSAAEAGNWPIDNYSAGTEVARAPVTPFVAPATRGRLGAGAPLPDLLDNLAPPPIASISGDTYLLFADGFYARNETSSWMPYVMFGAADESSNGPTRNVVGNQTTDTVPELRLGIGLHRRLIDRVDLTIGYRAQYQGPRVIEGDHDEPIRHDVGLRLRYRF